MSESIQVVSWNVNSLRVRLPQVLRFIEEHVPDVLALQETKLTDPDFPLQALQDAGYHCLYTGQKTYNGVALLTRSQPEELMQTSLPDFSDEQRRILVARVRGIDFYNLYVPNGAEVDSDKYHYKLEWLRALERLLRARALPGPAVLLGDFNIAPDDRDVHDPELWRDRILCSAPERARLEALLEAGFTDCFRLRVAEAGHYSWWDYRAAGFRRNLGLRIDLILASPDLAANCVDSGIYREPRAWEQPSDHAPVWARFAIG